LNSKLVITVWFAACLVLGAAVIFIGTQYRNNVVSPDLSVQPEGQLELPVQPENQPLQSDITVNQPGRFPQNLYPSSPAGQVFDIC